MVLIVRLEVEKIVETGTLFKDNDGLRGWLTSERRKYYLSATVEKRTVKTKSFSVQKDERTIKFSSDTVLFLWAVNEDSDIKFELFSEHKIQQDKCVASARISCSKLLVSDDCSKEIRLSSEVNPAEELVASTSVNQARLFEPIKEKGQEALTRANEATEVLQSSTWDPWFRGVETVYQAARMASQIHPFARGAFGILTVAYPIMVSQAARDIKINGLVENLNTILRTLSEQDHDDVSDGQKEIILQLSDELTQCAEFISTYPTDANIVLRTVHHLLDGYELEKQISQHTAKLAQLMLDYHTRTSNAIQKSIHEKIELRCAPEAYCRADKQCYPGTRVEILNEIHSWAKQDHSSRVLILDGAAGTGKSTIANTITKRLQEEEVVVSSFCFSRSDHINRKFEVVFPTLARYLADTNKTFKQHLGRRLQKNESLKTTQDIEEQFRELICIPASKLAPDKPIIIVLDALDESGHKTMRSAFIETFTGKIPYLPPNLKFFITCRPEEGLLQKLKSQDGALSISMTDMRNRSSTHHDILTYIRKQLEDIVNPNHGTGLKDEDCQILADRSEGLFQWAFLACSYIKGEGQRSGGLSVRDRYKHIVASSNKAKISLDNLYTDVLGQLFDLSDEDVQMRFVSVMGMIITAGEPLPMNALRQLRSYIHPESPSLTPIPFDTYDNDDDVSLILGQMGSLLTGVSIYSDEPVLPLHTSFHDYLVDPKRSGIFHINKLQTVHHQELALCSLRALNAELRFNICEIPTSHLCNAEVSYLQKRVQRCIPPHLRYAAKIWAKHLPRNYSADEKDRIYNSVIHHELKKFLSNHLLHWLEVMSIMKRTDASLRRVNEAIAWLKNMKIDQPLLKFSEDAEKFIRAFATTIATSFTHIYLSCLPFEPPSSLIYQNYAVKYQLSASIITGSRPDWPQELQTVIDAGGRVSSLAFSPDGREVVTSSYHENFVRFWHADTGVFIREALHGHEGSIMQIKFAPDPKTARIATASGDSTVRLWDSATGELIGEPLVYHSDVVKTVDFSADGMQLVSGSWDNTLVLYDLRHLPAAGKRLFGHKTIVLTAIFSYNGEYIASGSKDGIIIIWYATTGNMFQELASRQTNKHCQWVSSLAFSPDSHHLYSASAEKEIFMWNVSTGECVKKLQGHTDIARSVTVSVAKNLVASGSNDRTIRLWDPRSGGVISEPMHGGGSAFNFLTFSPDGSSIASLSSGGSIHLWSVEAILQQTREKDNGKSSNEIFAVALSSDMKLIATGSMQDGYMRLWDAESERLMRAPVCGHSAGIICIAFSPDGKWIASGSKDMTIRLWNASTGEPHGDPLRRHEKWVFRIAFSPDSKWLVSSGRQGFGGGRSVPESTDYSICLWDVESGECLRDFQGGADRVNALEFWPNGDMIAAANENGDVQLWNAHTAKLFGDPLRFESEGRVSVAFSPDGKHLACITESQGITLWEHSLNFESPFAASQWVKSTITFSLPPGSLRNTNSHRATSNIMLSRTTTSTSSNSVSNSRSFGSVSESVISMESVTTSPALTSSRSLGSTSDNDMWESTLISPALTSSRSLGSMPEGLPSATATPIPSNGGTFRSRQGNRGSASESRPATPTFSPRRERHSEPRQGNEVLDRTLSRTVESPSGSTTSLVSAVRSMHVGLSSMSIPANEDAAPRYLSFNSTKSSIADFDPFRASQTSITVSPLTSPGSEHPPTLSGLGHGGRGWRRGVGFGGGKGGEGQPRPVAFSPDGKYIVASFNQVPHLWNTTGGGPVGRPLLGHSKPVRSLAFSKDGRWIISGKSGDGTSRIWDVEALLDEDKSMQAFSSQLGHSLNMRPLLPFPTPSPNPLASSLVTAPEAIIDYDPISGWILGPRSELVLWVHQLYRKGLITPGTVKIFGAERVELDLHKFVHGTSWSKCLEG